MMVVTTISIHSARVGGDFVDKFPGPVLAQFQSTPPVWAETRIVRQDHKPFLISIHSARVGGDNSG